jgi:P2 family phage contractile tail tube protein
MSAAAQILKNFNLFVDGRGYAGNIDEITLPVLDVLEEDYRAGGMDAPVGIDMGMEKLTASFKLSKFDREVLALWGVAVGGTIPFVFRGALESLDGSVQAVVINMTGRIKTVETDSVTPGAKAGQTFTLSLTAYRYEQDSVVVHDIDVLNMKRIIGGVDRLAQIRAAIGI